MIAIWVALAILVAAAVVLAGVSTHADSRSKRVVGFSVK
jgi:hypothetical protein